MSRGGQANEQADGVEDAESEPVFTIGHGARPLEDFLAELAASGIATLADVRTAPGSRKHPQFGRIELSTALAARGIGYEWIKALGGWRRPRPDSPHTALRSASFRGYADHMHREEFARALAELRDLARASPTAFMCSETLWWRCHRRMIADAITVAGGTVVHLVGGKRQPHLLHPNARAQDGVLIYDVPTASRRSTERRARSRRSAEGAAPTSA